MDQETLNRRFRAAVNNEDFQSAKSFLAQGALINCCDSEGWTALHLASLRGYFEIVEYLVENGADLHAKENEVGQTPLHFSIGDGYIDIVKYLIEKGSSIDLTDHNGKTAIDLANEYKQVEIFDFLVAHKENKSLGELIQKQSISNQSIEF